MSGNCISKMWKTGDKLATKFCYCANGHDSNQKMNKYGHRHFRITTMTTNAEKQGQKKKVVVRNENGNEIKFFF